MKHKEEEYTNKWHFLYFCYLRDMIILVLVLLVLGVQNWFQIKFVFFQTDSKEWKERELKLILYNFFFSHYTTTSCRPSIGIYYSPFSSNFIPSDNNSLVPKTINLFSLNKVEMNQYKTYWKGKVSVNLVKNGFPLLSSPTRRHTDDLFKIFLIIM